MAVEPGQASIVLETLKRGAAIPSMPQVVTRFLEIIEDREFDFQDVVDVLSTDPGTAGEILRLANSPLFGVARKVTTLRHALILLGARRVRSLVLGRYIVQSIGQHGAGGLDTGYYWRRSLIAGVLAARFADILCPRCREEVFVAALLADIGVAVLAGAMRERYAPILAQYCPHGRWMTEAEETEAVKTTHAEVSAMVLEHWQLPEVICKAVRMHHSECVGGDEEHVLTRILNGADRFAKLLCETPRTPEMGEACRVAMKSVGIGAEAVQKVLGAAEDEVADLAQTLHIDVIPGRVYSKIAKAIGGQLAEATAEDGLRKDPESTSRGSATPGQTELGVGSGDPDLRGGGTNPSLAGSVRRGRSAF